MQTPPLFSKLSTYDNIVQNLCEYEFSTFKYIYSLIKHFMKMFRGPLSLVSTTEELLDRKVAAPV
jgi:hypothetical protein